MAGSLADMLAMFQAAPQRTSAEAPAAKQGLGPRLAELEAEGMPKAQALMTAADEGLIDPRMVETMLRRMSPAQATTATEPPLQPSRSFPPSAPQASAMPPSFPPSGPAPRFPPSGPAPQIDPALLAALLRSQGGR